MADTTREHILESIIVDLCDGEREWYEIQERTGVSEERAMEMAEVIDRRDNVILLEIVGR